MSSLSYKDLEYELRGKGSMKEDTYVTSPLYYRLTGRKGAWLYKGHKSALVACEHPQIENRILIFPEVGKADYELTASVLGQIDPPENGVQLARHSTEELVVLKRQMASISYTPVSGVEVREEQDMDWRYPVHILDTKATGAMEGRHFKKIRNHFRKAAQSVSAKSLTFPSGLRGMRAALKFWEGNMINKEKDVPGMADLYEEFFDVIEDNPESAEGILFEQEKRPVGFSVWDKPYNDTANLLANLGDTTVRGLSEFQTVSVCQKLNDQGVGHLNRGGSELQSLDSFKTKFQPVKTLNAMSADVKYRNYAHDGVEVYTVVQPS